MFYTAHGERFRSPRKSAGMSLSVAWRGVCGRHSLFARLEHRYCFVFSLVGFFVCLFVLIFTITERIEDLKAGPDIFFF